MSTHRVDARPGRERALQLVADNFPALAHSLLGPLLELLSLAREACGGDSDKYLIMLVVAIRTTGHEQFASYCPAELMSGKVQVFPTLGANVRSVADSIGAPKETVRRKVAELVEAGWIDREGHDLRFTAVAYQRLAGVGRAMERMAVRNWETVDDLLQRS